MIKMEALPMESNPETMNNYLRKLGVPDNWRMVDVIGLEDEALKFVPRPVLAVVLLFPLSEAYEKHRTLEETELKITEPPKNVFHLKQVLSNVCGTIALVHSIANNANEVQLGDGLLKNYINDAQNLDSAAKGELLERSEAILEAYKELVRSTNPQAEPTEEPVNYHFVTFIQKDGRLYELDGRKSFPIDHGPSTSETLMEDAAMVCRKFIKRDPDNIGFNIVALVPAQ